MKTRFKHTKLIFSYILLASVMLVVFSACKRNKTKTGSNNHSKHHSNHLVDKVIKTARNYTGVPYKFGGINRLGMDCSGLLFTSFKDNGIDIPRPSKDQALFGEEVRLVNLKPGDWLFFTDKEGNSKIVHVGMVTEVRGEEDVRFINASNKLGVVEDQLYIKYWQKVFIKAVRPKCFVN